MQSSQVFHEIKLCIYECFFSFTCQYRIKAKQFFMKLNRYLAPIDNVLISTFRKRVFFSRNAYFYRKRVFFTGNGFSFVRYGKQYLSVLVRNTQYIYEYVPSLIDSFSVTPPQSVTFIHYIKKRKNIREFLRRVSTSQNGIFSLKITEI